MANEKYLMMSQNPTGTGSFSMNRRSGSAVGTNSHTEGTGNIASSDSAHAEGMNTTASEFAAHSEGNGTTASGFYTHAEGTNTTASGTNAHAEGNSSARASTVTTSTVDSEIQTAWTSRKFSLAKGQDSHVEGVNSLALGTWSHAEGSNTRATGMRSHAEGSITVASGDSSHSGGTNTTASNDSSTAIGKYNAAMTTGGLTSNTVGTAFVIGNGTSATALSNAFSVQFSGVVKAKSTITASVTADYAEFFEWADGNPDAEDRIGHFVTLVGDKIQIASSPNDYILGVVSGEPFVLGNGDCDTWTGMFLRDEYRRTIYEPAPKVQEVLDSEGNPTGEYEEIAGKYEGVRPKLNPEYDPSQTYVSRFDRPEWSPICMLGVVCVNHDGTAQVGGYVTVNADGIATACDTSAAKAYRVIKATSDSVVEIIFSLANNLPSNLAYISGK